ncbi:MAG: nucleoside deaminase [Clostridia bacterium]|nr:nucleoside deaminase [Clostridia bacterium]
MKNKRYLPDHRFMKEAIALAKEAEKTGDIPVGAVVVRDGVIIGRGYNRRERDQSATAHAEICAIEDACRTLGSWHLDSCELYVTLEPCPMCAGAIINSRIGRVIFGAYDPKAGSLRSVTDLFSLPYNHRPEIWAGVMEEETRALLEDFFRKLRKSETALRAEE